MRREKRRKRAASAVAAERLRRRAEKAAEAERAETARKAKEADIVAAMARKVSGVAAVVENFLRRAHIDYGISQGAKERFSDLLSHLSEVTPRLIGAGYFHGLRNLAEVEWIRPLGDWDPCGKGRETLFRDLCEHLLASYRMPTFLWSAFYIEQDAAAALRFVAHVAKGGSAYEMVTNGTMPAPLTRKMCHELLGISGNVLAFLPALRWVQIRACGGEKIFLRTWLATPAGRALGTRANEEFWFTVMRWFCANPMLPASEVGPLCDYIAFRRREDANFSMKGRSVLAVQRGMQEWHAHLQQVKVTGGKDEKWSPSGFSASDWDRSRRDSHGNALIDVWHMREVLDGKTLADEGRAMSHCVYSYAGQIKAGRISIWALTNEDAAGHWRRLTIEVDNQGRRVVQARGRFNRAPEAKDLTILNDWAGKNGLTMIIGRLGL